MTDDDLPEDYRDIVERLTRPVQGVDLNTLAPRLKVLCGLGGRGRDCGRRIGELRSSRSLGWVWIPHAERDDRTVGSAPLAFTERSAELWFLFGECEAGHSWSITPNELIVAASAPRKSKSLPKHIMRRAIPNDWGPLKNDPKYWTQEEFDEMHRYMPAWVAGDWPPAGMAAVHASQVRARMFAMAEIELSLRDGVEDPRLEHLRRFFPQSMTDYDGTGNVTDDNQ